MKTSLEKIRSSWRHEWLLKSFFEGDRLVTLVQLADGDSDAARRSVSRVSFDSVRSRPLLLALIFLAALLDLLPSQPMAW
eukprot:CAMPEP_0169379032 /NCGR_PEP_ID=MMETSP1017-20121227/40100_1 /TAXON_ID=342587 /ORGANISM="Karlodinium micrum, Strain CCMP2283" /LENGTH=79 /DNA_ID=CAMNT_0009478341 /DNA_START=102 /DNA_END=338 /DNA_ORIENTATION=-